jgi:CO/xanthine dehydrogenase FAD-binding subunit
VVRSAAVEKDLLQAVNAFRVGNCSRDDLTCCAAKFDLLINPIDDQRGSAGYRRQVAVNILQYFLEGLCR